MDWTEVKITVPCDAAETAEAIALMVVPYGVYVEDYSDLEEGAREIAHIDLIDEQLLTQDRDHAVIHLYLDATENPAEALGFLRERYAAAGVAYQLDAETVHDADWANNWKRFFKPLPVGETLLIRPTWETVEDADGRHILSIDPGAAFGTGSHDTTRLVLETLERYVRQGDEILDIGCGSGILSIAALLFGASHAVGVDIDELAVRTAVENGAQNGFVPPQYEMRVGDLAKDITGTYRVVVANIVADAIIALTPSVPPFLAEDGVYIVSGIIESREPEVQKALAENGFTVTERLASGGWLCLVAKR